jgi:two-component system cell cycle response regulator DivK
MVVDDYGVLVLLVDDEPDQIDMYRFSLEIAGFRVAPAYRGSEAIQRAGQLQPDVIVLDVRLPDMTGWDVCKQLKADRLTAHIPIVILTAAASPTAGQRSLSAGCAAFLLKPCFPETLIETLRELIPVVTGL